MASFSRLEVLNAMVETGLIPVFYHKDVEVAKKVVEACAAGGARTVVNPSGGAGLAKGGTGDVLTGLIAGLWTQMLASGRSRGDLGFWAAALGAWLHGRAGELAEAELSAYAMTAQDVIDHLPAAFKELL